MRLAALACLWAFSSGCAATMPVLAEPRLVREGEVRFQVGAAAATPVAGDTEAVNAGRDRLAAPEVVRDDRPTTELVLPAVAAGFASRPGVAPVTRATLRLSREVEANMHFGGRDAHLGARYLVWEARSADAGAATFSVGLDGHALLQGRSTDSYINATSETVRGFGGAVPLILGWQSDAGLLIAYLGAIVGYERITARVLTEQPDTTITSRGLTLGRFHTTGTLGVGVGFRRVRVIVEMGVRRDSIHGELGDVSQTITLWSLTPAFSAGFNF